MSNLEVSQDEVALPATRHDVHVVKFIGIRWESLVASQRQCGFGRNRVQSEERVLDEKGPPPTIIDIRRQVCIVIVRVRWVRETGVAIFLHDWNTCS